MQAIDPTNVVQLEEWKKIARGWGWTNPPKEVIQIAKEALRARSTPSGQMLVDAQVITPEQRDRWLESKPDGVQTITWFSQQDSTVTPHVERVVAVKAGTPYYEDLGLFSVHPCMQDSVVLSRADQLDAVVMLIEQDVPVIIFATFSALIKFRSQGRAEKRDDPILKHVGEDPFLAIGARDEISSVLNHARSDDVATPLESLNVWLASSAENQAKPENRAVTRLIDHALAQGATDIALKPFRTGEVQVQMRKFGEMISPSFGARMPPELARGVISMLMAKSGANPSGTIQREPRDGQITYRSSAGEVFLRMSFIPLNHLGEVKNLTSVSARLLPRAEASIHLSDLRLPTEVVDPVRFAMRMSQGLVLVVGPTNSGKSTTIAGSIGEHVDIYGDRRKRLSVEDPIERFLYGITQINVPWHIKDERKRFEAVLPALKRHDPDLLWIGEVRDQMTADLCVSSASTGHLVLSSIHANDTVMGFDVLSKTVHQDKRFQLIEAMSLVISQRLVKEVCPHCSVGGPPTDEERQLFNSYLKMLGESAELPGHIAHANKQGCDKCFEGYTGLLPINEILPFTREVKDAAISLASGINARATMANARSLTLLQSSMTLLREMKTDLESVLV